MEPALKSPRKGSLPFRFWRMRWLNTYVCKSVRESPPFYLALEHHIERRLLQEHPAGFLSKWRISQMFNTLRKSQRQRMKLTESDKCGLCMYSYIVYFVRRSVLTGFLGLYLLRTIWSVHSPYLFKLSDAADSWQIFAESGCCQESM